MAAVRILIADGEKATPRSISFALGGGEYQIRTVTDGEQGLSVATQWHPHILMVDVNLPKMDGLTLVKTLRSRPDGAFVPVIFLAERSAVEERMQGFLLGADAFLPKPLNSDEIDACIKSSLRTMERAETTVRIAPAEASDFTSMLAGFRGKLEEVGLASLLGLMEMDRKTGLLVLIPEPERKKARLFIRQGRVERARIDGQEDPKNAELLYWLLGKTTGKFDFRPVAVDQGDEISTPTTQLLLEGARRLDEGRRPVEES